MLDNPAVSGIFNVGTGASKSFNDVANAVINWHGYGEIQYIDFPDELTGSYQSFTEADINALRKAGYPNDFMAIDIGMTSYLDWMNR